MKNFLWIVLVLILQVPLQARFMRLLSYSDRKNEADLIVIAMPVAIDETTEKRVYAKRVAELNQSTSTLSKDFIEIGVETKFQVLSVLKGDAELKNFILHHYREAEYFVIESGPNLVDFRDSLRRPFLLYLKREDKNRYVAVSGQDDPDRSIFKLEKGTSGGVQGCPPKEAK